MVFCTNGVQWCLPGTPAVCLYQLSCSYVQAVVSAAEGRRKAERHAEALAQRLHMADAASASAAQQLAEASEART